MKRVPVIAAAVAIVAGALPAASLAGPNYNAKIAIHLLAPTYPKNPEVPGSRSPGGVHMFSPEGFACTRTDAQVGCGHVITHGDLYPKIYFAHVLVLDGDPTAGIAGLQFGIEYGSASSDGIGIDIWNWQLCATMEFNYGVSPAWPESGSGNMITWDYVNACQRFVPPWAGGVTANAGFFYLAAYSPADLYVTVRPVDGYAKVASCAAEEDVVAGNGEPPFHLGVAGFGPSHYGYDGCGGDPVRQITWSGIKSMYRAIR